MSSLAIAPNAPFFCRCPARLGVLALLLTSLWLGLMQVAMADVPARDGRVRDDAGLWQSERVLAWEQRLENYYLSSGNEVALLTLQSLQGRDIDALGREVFSAWGLDEARHAALLVVAMDESLARVQVSRSSREVLPEQLSLQILRDVVVPAMQRNPAKGLEVGLESLKEALSARMSYTPTGLPWGNYARLLLSVVLLSAALFLLGARARQLALPFAVVSMAALLLAVLYQLLGGVLLLLGGVVTVAVWGLQRWRASSSGRASAFWPEGARQRAGGLSDSLGARARQARRQLRR